MASSNPAKANPRGETLLRYQLRSESTREGKLAVAATALRAMGGHFDGESVDVIAGELKGAALTGWSLPEDLPETANTAFLRIMLTGDDGSLAAVEAWERFFAQRYNYDPFHRMAYARALAGQSRYPEAARQLQLALSQPVRYSFFPRAEKLIRAVSENVPWHFREVRIAVLATSTTSLLIPILEALCLRDRIRAVFYQGLYGALDQEILDAESGLARFRPEVVFLMNHWRDLALRPISDDPAALVQLVTERQNNLWRQLTERFACHIVQHSFDFPAADAYGPLAYSLEGGRARVIEGINRVLTDSAPGHVSVLDTGSLQRQAGNDRWEDPVLWHSFKQHPATEALPTLAELQQAHLRAILGLSRKVLAVDLDNTLWKGIIGEDGLQGIEIGPGTAAGEAHQRLHEYLLDLKSRGILLAVCSKNNPEDALLPFENHAHMTLNRDDFAAFHANWNDKALNLREIAEELSLGLESFVFLDDSPIEREWVRSQLPQVAVVELGPSASHYVRDLDRGHYFLSVSLSPEDLARSEQYRKETQREALRSNSQSLDEFLAQLQLEASVAPVSESNLARVTQLANKTNQFNLTTRRYTEAQIRLIAADARAWTGAFQLADRMGNYGLIGLILCVPAGSAHWEIETWLMSCRALGRQMERFMLDCLLKAASDAGITAITGVYRPTAKNGLVADLYESLGFTRRVETAEEVRFAMAVPASPPITATHIRNVGL